MTPSGFFHFKQCNCNTTLRISCTMVSQRYAANWASLTWYLKGAATNPVTCIYIVGWSKALNQCTIQCGGCNATQCWGVGSSTCSKPSPRPCCEGITLSTNRGRIWSMWQWALTAPIHSPDGVPIHVSNNSTSEGEGITRTGGGSCSELCSNIICNKIYVKPSSVYQGNGRRERQLAN